MTDEQIRLYAIARTIVHSNTRIASLAEPTSGGRILYTLILTPSQGDRRWFAVHAESIRVTDDRHLALELLAAIY